MDICCRGNLVNCGAKTTMSCANNVIYAVGALTILVLAWRALLCFYRRVLKPAKNPKSYGKWAIVTGSTAGIGKEYADYLAKMGMSVLIISRSESKLKEQVAELQATYKGAEIKYIAYDYTDMGPAREEFYRKLDKECGVLDKSGGIGLLINNVGIANQYPQLLVELSDKEVSDMINCNIDSCVFMTRAVLKYMVPRNSGAIINVSSGSGNVPSPHISVYSATKAFMTQFSRSMHMEYYRSGIDVLCVMPLFVVSQKYRKEKGTLFAPMPIALVKGTFKQLGKKYFWQANGYWFHTFLQFCSFANPLAAMNALKRVEAHRANYAAKLAKQQAAAKKD